jgi:phasin family protein
MATPPSKTVAQPRRAQQASKPAASKTPAKAPSTALTKAYVTVASAATETSPPAAAPKTELTPIPSVTPVEIAASAPATSLKSTALKPMEKIMQMNKEQFEKAGKAVFTQFDVLLGFGKDNVEAVVKSSTIVAKGVEDLTKAMVAMSQHNLETSVAATKAAFGATTLKQVVDLQTDFAKSSYEQIVTETGKLSELSLKVANEAAAPIQGRVNVAIEKFMKPIAA